MAMSEYVTVGVIQKACKWLLPLSVPLILVLVLSLTAVGIRPLGGHVIDDVL
jgi:hypothetical protein